MKKHLMIVGLLSTLASISAFAVGPELGPSVSGGSPPAPMAVVIQGHLTEQGVFDEEGRKAALEVAGRHLVEDRLEAVAQRSELQSDDRTYLCVQYKSYSDTESAIADFKTALAGHPSFEIVSNTKCK